MAAIYIIIVVLASIDLLTRIVKSLLRSRYCIT